MQLSSLHNNTLKENDLDLYYTCNKALTKHGNEKSMKLVLLYLQWEALHKMASKWAKTVANEHVDKHLSSIRDKLPLYVNRFST